VDLADIDLNTLIVFDALLEQQSVTGAGRALGLSQPAMSAALAKLRTQVGDPLFMRTGRGMKPTPRALELASPVRQVLETVRTEILHKRPFDASTARRIFTILTPDVGEVVFMPKILAHAARQAPSIGFHSVTLPYPDARSALESGVVDLAIGYFPDLAAAGFYQQRLFRNTFACMVRADHPRIGRQLSTEEFMSAAHAVVRPAGRTHLFEQFLKQRDIQVEVRVVLSHFSSLLTIIAASDLIATIPLDIAQVFTKLANVRLLTPPVHIPPFDLKQHWHGRVHADPAHVWLRKMVREVIHD
jgi:DNA-binding transcriptional LysR family regulator